MNVTQIRALSMMKTTLKILENVLQNVSQEEATTYRDNGDGWTVLEVVGHLLDFEGFFRGRAEMMVAEDTPDLPGYDHEALAIANKYNEQNLRAQMAALRTSRELSREFYKGLSAESWQRNGNHPERDSFTMTDSIVQYSMHDADHLEQITRILNEKQTG